MKILADQHISPRTVEFLKSLGHDAVRVSDRLPRNASDSSILALAQTEGRIVLTQDLDFSVLLALSEATAPSVITLRLSSARVDRVNGVLGRILPQLESVVREGVVATVEDARLRIRKLPVQ